MRFKSTKTTYLALKLCLLSLFLGSLLLFTSPTQAAVPSQSISISPTSNGLTVAPGGTVSGDIYVFNQGSSGYDYTISVTPYRVSGENYNPGFTPTAGYPNITSWFSFKTTKGHLNSNDSDNINYKISVPKITLPGSYYAVVFAETQPEQTPGSGILAQKRVGTIFYLTVAGRAVVSDKVASFKVPLFQKPPVTATLRVENDGSVYQKAKYRIVMKNLLTGKSQTFNDSRYVLQQTIRKLVIPWTGGPTLGLFKISGTVSFSNQVIILPTRYTLVSSPTNLIIIIALIGLVIAFIIREVLKLRRRRKDAASKLV